MINRVVKEGAFYGAAAGTILAALIPNQFIYLNVLNVPLPPSGDVLSLNAHIFEDNFYLGGQGKNGGRAVVYSLIEDKWYDLGSCHGAGNQVNFWGPFVYIVKDNDTYEIRELHNLEQILETVKHSIGVNGIRRITSVKAIITGDETYGSADPNIHLAEYTPFAEEDTYIGQSYYGGCVIATTVNGKRYRSILEFGDTRFIKVDKNVNQFLVTITKPNEGVVFLSFVKEDIISLEQEHTPENKIPNTGDVPIPDPKEPPKMDTLNLPNHIELVRSVIREHTEIDVLDENQRGKIVDIIAHILNGSLATPYGRKARNADGSNKNTDGLTYLHTDGRFTITDIIFGADPNPNNPDRGKFASWDTDGRLFKPGENGFWSFAEPVGISIPNPPKPNPDPKDNPPVNTVDLSEVINTLNLNNQKVIEAINQASVNEINKLDEVKVAFIKGIKEAATALASSGGLTDILGKIIKK